MTVQIDTTAENNGLRLIKQGTHPSAPSAGHVLLYYVTGTAQPGLFIEDVNGAKVGPFITGTSNSLPYYSYLAASLEPDAIEPLQISTFNYLVSGTANPKMLMASFATRLGSAGRFEVRNPQQFAYIPSGTNLVGLSSNASAEIINPGLVNYSDAYSTYYTRLQSIAEGQLRQVNVLAPATYYPFLLGAYGAIVTRAVNFDFDYISVQNGNASGTGLNLGNEVNDTVAQRLDEPLFLAMNKLVATELYAGAERSAGVGRGTVTYFLCPSNWSGIPDSTTYLFRDDFMAPSLNKTQTWNASGTLISIDTTYQWLKAVGTTTWGANGIYARTSVARASGRKFICDVYTGRDGAANAGLIVGFSDGLGYSYTNFSHGVLFSGAGAVPKMQIYENGNLRGEVGSNYVPGCIYRIRITIGASNNATYEIQGGVYAPLGGPAWTTLTPGVASSSSTTPLYAGASTGQTGTMYVSDIKVF